MNTPLSFVALDLETTGLNPEIDKIIEIAAIKFEIVFDGKVHHIQNVTEKTMLVNPEIPITEEITLITGISEKMLANKPKWQDIQQKVQDFIPHNAIILGHNVFFDIAVLSAHDIDLSTHNIVDTFELSEILSQDAKSLNLGFLADFYHIPKRWAEHRALTDTWVSVDLFLHFLQKILSLDSSKQYIWQKYILSPTSPLSFLAPLCAINSEKNLEISIPQTEKNILKEVYEKNTKKSSWDIMSLENISSQNATENIEQSFLEKYYNEYKNLEIITINQKTASLVEKNLANANISCIKEIEFYQFIHTTALWEEIQNNMWNERKYSIFLFKMLFWLLETKTGNVNELKYYGNEFEWLQKFRLQADETNIFRRQHERQITDFPVIIRTFRENLFPNPKRKTLFRDIELFENTIRKAYRKEIHFETLIHNITLCTNPHSENLISALRMIEGIYFSLPNRPKWEQEVPPGKYGETYFLTQNNIWHQGGKWLSLATMQLFNTFKQYVNTITRYSRFENILFQKIKQDISHILRFHIHQDADTNAIINIIHWTLSVQYIDKNIAKKSHTLFCDATGYGFHIHSNEMQQFLKNELPDNQNEMQFFGEHTKQITKFVSPKNALHGNKILILTTSMKHIREIGNSIRKDNFQVFMQWISGGKSKMKHYFLENIEKKSVLIGLLDSFREESDIFENIDTLIIAKIPFDPPTDPDFLAKTSGMPNSFENYSKPLVLAKLNSLIGNSKIMNPSLSLVCTDERIYTTEWGKFVGGNLY